MKECLQCVTLFSSQAAVLGVRLSLPVTGKIEHYLPFKNQIDDQCL